MHFLVPAAGSVHGVPVQGYAMADCEVGTIKGGVPFAMLPHIVQVSWEGGVVEYLA